MRAPEAAFKIRKGKEKYDHKKDKITQGFKK
jgi:hypothetical protein